MATTDAGTGAATAAAIMAFSFGGVTTEHFILGCGCYVVGAMCRFGLRVSTALESGQEAKFGRALATLSISPFLASFASLTAYFAAHIVGFEGDAAIGILLAITALKGAEGIQWLTSIVSKALPGKLTGEAKDQKS